MLRIKLNESRNEAKEPKFLDEFEKQLKAYSFHDGKKVINVEAK